MAQGNASQQKERLSPPLVTSDQKPSPEEVTAALRLYRRVQEQDQVLPSPETKKQTVTKMIKKHPGLKNVGICREPVICCVRVTESTCCCCFRVASWTVRACQHMLVLVAALIATYAVFAYIIPGMKSFGSGVTNMLVYAGTAQARRTVESQPGLAEEEAVAHARATFKQQQQQQRQQSPSAPPNPEHFREP